MAQIDHTYYDEIINVNEMHASIIFFARHPLPFLFLFFVGQIHIPVIPLDKKLIKKSERLD